MLKRLLIGLVVIALVGLGAVILWFGGNDRKTYGWASGFLGLAAATFGWASWLLAIARRATRRA